MTTTQAPAPVSQATVPSRGPAVWRNRSAALTGAALLLVAALAWVVVVRQAADMASMGGMPPEPTTPTTTPTGPAVSAMGALAFVGAWGVMMAAMMLPSATPMILLYGTIGRNLSESGQRVVPLALFAAVYLAVWMLFGVPVYLADALVRWLAAGNAVVAVALPYALAVVLVAAGAYQFTAFKRACLRKCQSPFGFLMTRWRSGYGGTIRVAIVHAGYCVGCCGGLMVVLVAAGAMGLNWVLLIAAAVFAEKLLPRGEWTAWGIGAALVGLGLVVAARPDLAMALRGQTMGM